MEAALLAGLYPRELIAEPTAAAIAYGVDKFEAEKKCYLVYDLGGGTFDVSIITVEEEDISIVATSGDSRLGGADFDEAIVRWAVAELKESHQIDISEDAAALAKLRLRAEQTKVLVRDFEEAQLVLQDVIPGQDEAPPSLALTRSKFEELIEPLLTRTLTSVDTAINLAQEQGIERDHIDAILLVGGSSKIPAVRAKLLDHFNQDESFAKDDLNPDTIVARGAAMMGLRYSPHPPPFNIKQSADQGLVNLDADEVIGVVHRITEHTLSVGVTDGRVTEIIRRSSPIPAKKTRSNFINEGPSDRFKVPVFQGEGEYQHENTLIGRIELGPMEPRETGYHRFSVTFELDMNGLLTAIVHHENENKNYQAQIDNQAGLGGLDALELKRQQLLKMMSPATEEEPVDRPSPPPPPPPIADHDAEEAEPEVDEAETPPLEMPQFQQEPPEQFGSLVRRVQKLLTKHPDSELMNAFVAFAEAVNGGDEQAILDRGDELEDMYHDARKLAQ